MILCNFFYFIYFIVVLIVFFLIGISMKVVKEYERIIVFRLGRFIGTKGPGLFFLIPIVDRFFKVDVRVTSIDVPSQEIITKDNVSVIIDAVVYYKVEDPQKAIIEVQNYIESTFLIAQTTLRKVLGSLELDSILSEKDSINKSLQEIIDKQINSWGVKVLLVELKEIILPENMKRVMAKQAETEREKRSKLIKAQAEYEASFKLMEAAKIMNQSENTIQLRYLQTFSDVSKEKSSTIFFPLPLDLLKNIFKSRSKKK